MDDHAPPTGPTGTSPVSMIATAVPTPSETPDISPQIDLALNVETAVGQRAAQAKARWWSSLPLITLLAIIFYAQGRAFTESYLDYFGLNASQFPVTPDNAYWEALMGWAMVAGKGPDVLWHMYPQYLLAEWIPLTATVLLPVLGLVGRKRGWWTALGKWIVRVGNARPLRWLFARAPRDIVRHVAYGGMPAVVLMSIPLMLLTLTFVIALLIGVFVIPFWSLGRAEAKIECENAAENYPSVHYVSEAGTANVDKSLSTARLLQCGPEFCALIRDGEAFVIPRTAIQSVGGVPIGGNSNAAAKVPHDRQLCYRPRPKAPPLASSHES